MKKKILVVLPVLMAALVISGSLMAQDTTPAPADAAVEEPKEKDPIVKVSGLLYAEYKYQAEHGDTNDGKNAFDLSRFYLTVKSDVTKNWTLRFTSDIDVFSNDSYEVFAKYGYIQYKDNFGAVSLKTQVGLVATPMAGFMNSAMDTVWIRGTLLGSTGDVLSGSIDSTADLGVKVDVSIMKVLTLTGMVCNGEGYKKVTLSDQGKAFYGMALVNPFADLFLFGYFQRDMGDDSPSKNYNQYYGGGAAWKSGLIKAGANISMSTIVAADVERSSGMLIDGWLHMNLDSAIGLPILIYGRCAYGKDDKRAADKKNTLIGGGIGYKFNKYIRTLAIVDYLMKEDSYNDKVFYVKAEGNF
ncbi:MAG: hypothetical protein GY754_37000 [bacterium]|nr:hypothetical protein [bacterium]